MLFWKIIRMHLCIKEFELGFWINQGSEIWLFMKPFDKLRFQKDINPDTFIFLIYREIEGISLYKAMP